MKVKKVKKYNYIYEFANFRNERVCEKKIINIPLKYNGIAFKIIC